MIDSSSPDFADLPGLRALSRIYKRSKVLQSHIDVSIVTPYYNTEALFMETWVSIQAQSLQNWEWIITDDGSTDPESIQRLTHVAHSDDRITVIRQDNSGPSAARNNSFRQASGRYICLLDSDDMIEPTYLEKCVWFLDSNPEFSFCNAYSVVFGDQQYLWTTGFERGRAHLQANSGPPISVIRRAAYADCGGFDESIRFGHEDWDFWLAMASTGHWGHTLNEYLQWYRKRGTGRFEQIMRSGNTNEEFERHIRSKYASLHANFPAPTRRFPRPYESIQTNVSVQNSMANNPMGRRVMFLVPWMVTGGADRVNLDLIEGLTTRGHDVTVCATLIADHQWEHQFSRFTPDIFILPNLLHPTDYPRFLAYLLKSRQIDTVLITGSTLGYQLLPYLRAVSPGVAFVDMCHVEEPHWQNGGHPRFGVGYQDMLDLNIVTTQHLANWMEACGADIDRVRVMYTGIRSTAAPQAELARTQIRRDLNLPSDVPLIVFAGRLCEQKRPALLAEILKTARDQGYEYHALIIGQGELKEKLENLLNQYHLTSQVHMIGAVSHQRWLDLLRAVDILLMPSQYEGISIALLEAMATGVVPVVANVGGQNEIVSRDAGFLIPHADNEVQLYVAALGALLSDSSLLRSMSSQCIELAHAKFSWGASIDRLTSIIDEAHQLRCDHPRHAISEGLGREFSTLALENKRLGEAVEWLWHAKDAKSPAHNDRLPIPVNALVRVWTLFASNRLGAIILRSQRLRTAVRWLLDKLETRHRTPR